MCLDHWWLLPDKTTVRGGFLIMGILWPCLNPDHICPCFCFCILSEMWSLNKKKVQQPHFIRPPLKKRQKINKSTITEYLTGWVKIKFKCPTSRNKEKEEEENNRNVILDKWTLWVICSKMFFFTLFAFNYFFFPSKKPGVHLKLPCHIQHAACSNLQHKFLTFEGLKANHTLTCMTKPCLQTCLPLSPLVLILAGDVSIKLLQSFLSVVMCKPCSAMCNNKSATCL